MLNLDACGSTNPFSHSSNAKPINCDPHGMGKTKLHLLVCQLGWLINSELEQEETNNHLWTTALLDIYVHFRSTTTGSNRSGPQKGNLLCFFLHIHYIYTLQKVSGEHKLNLELRMLLLSLVSERRAEKQHIFNESLHPNLILFLSVWQLLG